jgi:magnesium-transporting ATPase (P-type)
VLTSQHKAFFIHPYFFAVALATSAVIALVENSVGDYTVLTYEVWKAHMVSMLYFAVYWFTSKSKPAGLDTKDHSYRAQQEAVFTAVVLAVLSLLTTAMAPYTSAAYTNYLLWIPLQLALAAFIDVVYLSHLDPRVDQKSETIPNTSYWISSLVLILKALVVIHYWRDYSAVYNTMNQKIPTRSIQYNASYAWLTPTF